MRALVATPVALLLVVGVVLAAATPSVDWRVVGAGGAHLQQGGYTLDNTLGQPVVGKIGNGGVEICAGFWCGVEATEEVGHQIYLPIALR